MPTSERRAERRITVLASIYPHLERWAERDGLTVADVANAILLQNIRPYGPQTMVDGHQAPNSQSVLSVSSSLSSPLHPDPYQTASLDTW